MTTIPYELTDEQIYNAEQTGKDMDAKGSMSTRDYMWYSKGKSESSAHNYGGTFNGSTKLMMWLLGIFALASIGLGGWVGTTLMEHSKSLAEISTKLELVLTGRLKIPHDP